MFVRARAPRYADHRAALRDCRWVLTLFALSVAGLAGVLVYIQASPGMYVAEVHTRIPGLFAAAVIAFVAQATAIGVRYRDHLLRQRRRAEAAVRANCGCKPGQCTVDVAFSLPRSWRADGVVGGES